MEKKIVIINLAREFSFILGSRDIISELKKIIIKAPTERVDLDFEKIQFISRSVAHELLKLKEELFYNKQNSKKIRFINTNKDVRQILRIVASNRAVPKKKIPKLKLEVDNITSLIN